MVTTIRTSVSLLAAVPRRPALRFWAALMLVLVACAYLLATVLAAGCAFLAVVSAFSLFSDFNLWLALLAIGAGSCAVSIVWSILPRRTKLPAPGPALDPASQPRLFAEIAAIAEQFREPMPSTVYLMLEPNAWVAQRGGFLGYGGQRVAAVGLPLMAVLNLSEFRAVLAHEFAHYYGGDTRFGPYLQKSRDALAGSLRRLSSDFLNFMSRWAIVAILRLIVIFILSLYWKLFLRLTLLVSRKWEYRADELACAVAGSEPLVSGLRKVESAGLAWRSFWTTEAAPFLHSGFRPPLAGGFEQFLAAPAIAKQVETITSNLLEKQKPGAFDSHPTYSQRAARALSYSYQTQPEDRAPALTLLSGFEALELSALKKILPEAGIENLPLVSWEEAGPKVYVPEWRRFTAEYRDLLAPYSVSDIPRALANLGAFAAAMRDPKGMLLTREQRAERAMSLLWIAFNLALLDNGWELQTQPGNFCLKRGADKLAPSVLVRGLKSRAVSEVGYRQIVTDLGIPNLPLAPAPVTPMRPIGVALAVILALVLGSLPVRAQTNAVQSFASRELILRHIGDRPNTVKLKQKDLGHMRGTCDIGVLVTNAAWKNGTAEFEVEPVGSPSPAGRTKGHCSGASPAKLQISGFAPDESAESAVLAISSVLQTPEQYLTSLGVPYSFTPEDDVSAPQLKSPPPGGSPKYVMNVYATYTEPARKARVQGQVSFTFMIGTDGRAHDIRITQTLDSGLDSNVLHCVALWRIEPPRVNGKPARMQASGQMTFRLL